MLVAIITHMPENRQGDINYLVSELRVWQTTALKKEGGGLLDTWKFVLREVN
jgi:hypothetical protein